MRASVKAVMEKKTKHRQFSVLVLSCFRSKGWREGGLPLTHTPPQYYKEHCSMANDM